MEKTDNYKILEKLAMDLGAINAEVIPADQIIVEDRVRLKCMVGCPAYGKTLKCPPYTPSTDDFRKIIKEYSFAMIIKLKLPDIIEESLVKNIQMKNGEARLRNQELSSMKRPDFSDHYRTMLTNLLEIERAAFNQGYTFAIAFYAGHCRLCEKCNVKNGICLNPMTARFSCEAMGINMLKTAKNAGIELMISTADNKIPLTPIAIILID